MEASAPPEERTISGQGNSDRRMHGFERLLTLWVVLCMGAGIALGRIAPGLARTLDGMTLDVDGAPVVSIPIADSSQSFHVFLRFEPVHPGSSN